MCTLGYIFPNMIVVDLDHHQCFNSQGITSFRSMRDHFVSAAEKMAGNPLYLKIV